MRIQTSTHLQTQEGFTRDFAKTLQTEDPTLTIKIEQDHFLKVSNSEEREISVFTSNAYDSYKANPEAWSDIIRHHIKCILESFHDTRGCVEKANIVPIIKDRPWLTELSSLQCAEGAHGSSNPYYEHLNEDLIILYAENTPQNLHYLGAGDLSHANVDAKHLRSLACKNLRRLLPQVERHGQNGYFMLTAGGTFEASLLLLEEIWEHANFGVDGEIVVAIPARDVLLITGSQDDAGLERMKDAGNELKDCSYHLTSHLFIHQEGLFRRFSPAV